MKILIIGGTLFLGRALVEAALKRGHEVTLFNRGKTNPDLFPEVEKLVGDRDGNLDALHGRKWDAVIDTCGYVPRIVQQSADLLADAAERYAFISSLSVYAKFDEAGMTESAAVGTLEDESVEEVTAETYGPLKALCEQAVVNAFGPERSLILRPGLIVGPHDPTDRFSYWPHRVAQGGEVLAPGDPDRIVQFTDVRDLAEFTIKALEDGRSGIYNINGMAQPLSMGELLETCQQVSGSDANPVWVDEKFLEENEVGEWIELPLWISNSNDFSIGFFTFDCSKAIEAGLRFRPLAETVGATLKWLETRPSGHEWKAGLKPEREQELLQKYASEDGHDGD